MGWGIRVVITALIASACAPTGPVVQSTPDPSAFNAAVDRAVASALAARAGAPSPSAATTIAPAPSLPSAVADLFSTPSPTAAPTAAPTVIPSTPRPTSPPAVPAPGPAATPAPTAAPASTGAVSLSSTAATAGGSIRVAWEIAAPNADDWFGFFGAGSSGDVLPLRQITGGLGAGSKLVNIPSTMDQGSYHVRLFAHVGFNRDVEIARTASFTITPPTVPVVTISPSQVRLDELYRIRYSGFPLGSQVRLSQGDQADIVPPFALAADPYIVELVFRSGQYNVNTSKSPSNYTITSTIAGKSYNVNLTLNP